MRKLLFIIALFYAAQARCDQPLLVFLGENNAADSSGNAAPVTVTGLIEYNSSNEYQGTYCLFPDNGRIFTDNAINFSDGTATFSLWIKTNILLTGVLLANSNGSGNNGFYLQVDGSYNRFVFYTCDASANAESGSTSYNSFVDNEMCHLVVEVDRANSKVRFFVNGVNVTADSVIQDDFSMNAAMSFFSNKAGTGLLYGDAFLDNMQVYDMVTTAAQRDSLNTYGNTSFMLGFAGVETPVVGYNPTQFQPSNRYFGNVRPTYKGSTTLSDYTKNMTYKGEPPLNNFSGKILYVDPYGDNGNDGLTVSTPITLSGIEATLDNTFDFIVLSDTAHYGVFNIEDITRPYGDPLTVKTWNKYGTGNASIKGLSPVTSWTQSGNYWTKTGISGLPDYFNQIDPSVYYYAITHLNGLYINGVWHGISKYPNTKTYYSMESSGSNYATDNQGVATNDYWNGATLVSETPSWINSKFNVSDYNSSGTYYINNNIGDQELSSTMKYFLMNHRNAEDVNGEWTINHTTNTVEIFYTGALNSQSVYLPLVDSVLAITGSSHIRVVGIDFYGGNKEQIKVYGSTGIEVDSCRFYRSPVAAIGFFDSDTVYARYNEIYYGNDNGIIGFRNDKFEASNNYMKAVGVDGTFGGGHDGRHLNGIFLEGDKGDILLSNNEIDSTGYCGIDITAVGESDVDVLIEKNYINDAMQVVSDGAAIYTYFFPYNSTKIIRNNLITNVYNNTAFHRDGRVESKSIYLDEGYPESCATCYNRGWIVDSNTIFDYPEGLFNNKEVRRVDWRDNKLVKSRNYGTYMGFGYAYNIDPAGGWYADSINVKNNTFVLGYDDGIGIYRSSESITVNHNMVDSNYYYNPFDVTGYVWLTNSGSPNYTRTYRNLAWVQANSTWEDNSTFNANVGLEFSETTGATEDQFIWLFANWSTTSHQFSLASTIFRDLDGTDISGTLTLAPYETKVLYYKSGGLVGLPNPIYVP